MSMSILNLYSAEIQDSQHRSEQCLINGGANTRTHTHTHTHTTHDSRDVLACVRRFPFYIKTVILNMPSNSHTWADYPLFLPLSLHTPMLKYVCLMHFCERTPSGSALHTSLLGVFAETQMCVGEIACHNIDVRSKSLSLCPFRLRRPGQGPGGAEAFFL